MTLSAPDPYIIGIVKYDIALFILIELHLHAHDLNVVYQLQVIAHLVAHLQAVSACISLHEGSIIIEVLFEVIVNLALVPGEQAVVEFRVLAGIYVRLRLSNTDRAESEFDEFAKADAGERCHLD